MALQTQDPATSQGTKRKLGVTTRQLKTQKKRKRSEVDALPWKELSVPDHLDDYEGFFGLEEVDDVDVVKDVEGGLKFQVKGRGDSVRKRETVLQGSDSATHDDEVEWEGFPDEPVEATDEVEHGQSDRSDVTKPGNAGNHNASEPDQVPQDKGNSFSALEDLANVEEQTDVRAWQSLELSDYTMSSIAHTGFSNPTPIQSSSIPHALNGQDLIGKAPTGSGKTLAFGLPIIEKWLSNRSNIPKISNLGGPVALIIEPTRELAHQIENHLKALQLPSHDEAPNIVTVTGGLSIQKQKRLLDRADIVIATPGRLWDVMESDQTIQSKLKGVSMLVIDEADRLLSRGNFQELEQVLAALDRKDHDSDEEEGQGDLETSHSKRQVLVFSATLSSDLQQKLAKKVKLNKISAGPASMAYLLQKLKFQQQPKYIDVNPETRMAPNLTEALLEIADTNKDLYLYAILLLYQPHVATRALVFVNSIAAVRRIVPFLQQLGMSATQLHSSMEQKARLKAIEQFTAKATNISEKKTSVLVATDVAARGLDIPDVHVVVHYHIPRAADMYVHRSGRTARAASNGASILMSSPNEAAGVRRLVAQVHEHRYENRKKNPLQILTIEDRIINQLRPRASLAKKIADAEQAKAKQNSTDRTMQKAADELGVDLEEEMDGPGASSGRNAKGQKRKAQEEEGRAMSKVEMKRLRAELRGMVSQRINMGVSQRYIANGKVDMAALLAERESSGFLGNVEGLSLQIDQTR